MEVLVLADAEWVASRRAHEERVDRLVGPHLTRRRAGEEHPVLDFLFTYYSNRPGRLRVWHPGYGRALDGPAAAAYADRPGYGPVVCPPTRRGASADTRPVGVTPALVTRRRRLVESVRELLAATAGRPPQLSCFGLHEWAMAYRCPPAQVRHPRWPLRLGGDGTDRVVERHRVACSHFDAVRFFTGPARPLNTLQPGPDNRPLFEQPGCLHAGMDLYKHAYRLSPLVASELVADCFELACDLRELDMRASPYDLSALGYPPVPIETAAGKQEYVAAQRRFAQRAAPLRARLLDECERLLTAVPADRRPAVGPPSATRR